MSMYRHTGRDNWTRTAEGYRHDARAIGKTDLAPRVIDMGKALRCAALIVLPVFGGFFLIWSMLP